MTAPSRSRLRSRLRPCSRLRLRAAVRVAALSLLVGVGAAGVLAGPLAGPARADGDPDGPPGTGERVRAIDVRLALRPDASMHVTETIRYDFGAQYRHGIHRYLPLKRPFDADRDRVYPITQIRVKSPTGAPDAWTRTADDPVTIRIGQEDRTTHGVQVYELQYDLAAVVDVTASGPELYWNAIGDGWQVPVDQATVTLTGPAGTPDGPVACYQGPAGSTTPCRGATAGGGTATFTAGSLKAHEGLTVVARLPVTPFGAAKPELSARWSFRKAFSATPASLGTGAVLLLLVGGGIALWARRHGRDRRYVGVVPGLEPAAGQQVRTARVGRRQPLAVQFTPPRDLGVGETGTLIDERADVLDVTATIVDLAVRGHLRIEEVPRTAGARPPAGADRSDGSDVSDDAADGDRTDDDAEPDDDWTDEEKAEFAQLSADLEADRAKREADRAKREAARAAKGKGRSGRGRSGPERSASAGTARAAEKDGPGGWRLVRTGKGKDPLRGYERTLYEAIFDGRDEVTLAELRSTFRSDLTATQDQLYAAVVERGWFSADPREVRRRWYRRGGRVVAAGVAATVLLAWLTRGGLVGVALTLCGVVILLLARRMPARTAAGTAALTQVRGFRLYLETAEADEIRFEEGQDVFSRYLPYAIVFGVAERWARVFAELAARSGTRSVDTGWYRPAGDSGALASPGSPGDLDLLRFGTAMSAFSSSANSSISTFAASSGSSSSGTSSSSWGGSSGFDSGSSGGGGGGGGGGSW